MDKEKVLEIAREVYPNAPIVCLIGEDDLMRFADAIEAATREECATDAELYRQLRAMQWNDKKLAVVKAADLKLGTMTYSLERLDEAIRNMGKEG